MSKGCQRNPLKTGTRGSYKFTKLKRNKVGRTAHLYKHNFPLIKLNMIYIRFIRFQILSMINVEFTKTSFSH